MKFDIAPVRARRAVHTAFFVLLVLAIWQGAAFTGCTYLQIGVLRLICPVGFIEALLSTRQIIWELVPGFVVVVGLIVLLGRAYCSWLCPASFVAQRATQAAFAIFPKRVAKPVAAGFQTIRGKMHALWQPSAGDALALCVGLAVGIVLAGFPAWSIICPVGTLSRALVDGIVHHSLRLDSLFLLLPVLAALFHAHGWKCLCPLGSVHGLISTANRTARVKVPTCNNCHACAKVCPMGLHPDPKSGEFKGKDCIKCLECLNICPQHRKKGVKKVKKVANVASAEKTENIENAVNAENAENAK